MPGLHITRAQEFEHILARTLRKAGLKRHVSAGDNRADLVFEKDGSLYVVELKSYSEGRSDRLIPLLSQAILQARASARERGDAIPVAIVAAPRIPASVAGQIRDFGKRYAPDSGVGAVDSEGLLSFSGFGLEKLDAKPSRPQHEAPHAARLPDLFSDLNQWMLKIMIGQQLPAGLISVPEVPIRNASHLAAVAGVSVMSASRLIRQLSERGFLDRRDEIPRLVRLEELFELWVSANRDTTGEIPARWILRKGPDQLKSALRDDAARHGGPRCCLGLFAAADALGYGFVHGAPSHIYLESVTADALDRLGLTLDHSGGQADVYIRQPLHREATFRAHLNVDGVPVSDILQVWLDVSTHPARGKEQAREIWRRVLKPVAGRV